MRWPDKRILKHMKLYKAVKFNKIAGIYFLMKDNSLQYIGSSTFIASRLCTHRQEEREFDRVFYIRFPGDLGGSRHIFMNELEHFLICCFDPPLNKVSGRLFWGERAREKLDGFIDKYEYLQEHGALPAWTLRMAYDYTHDYPAEVNRKER